MSEVPLLVRRATVNDAAACASIVRNWLDGIPWIRTAQPTHAELSNIIAEAIPDRMFWVIGEPIGGYLSFNEKENLIGGLYTASPGSGFGKALLDKVKSDHSYIQLWTHEPNTSAHRFYHREGFETVERKPDGRGDGVPELRMEWHK